MPKFAVSLSIVSEKKRDDGLAVSVEVKLGLKSKLELPENSFTVHKKLHRAKISILLVTNDEVRCRYNLARKSDGSPGIA